VSVVPVAEPSALARLGFTSKGLRLRPKLPFEEWREIGVQIGAFGKAYQWALGDWWFYGEWEYGSMYEEAMEVTDLTYQALADLKYVAGRFEFSRRRESLSISHHREVAALSQEEQDRWLDAAVENGWSVHKLRAALNGQLELGADPPALPPARAKKQPIQAPGADVQLSLLVEVPEEVLGWTEWSEPVQIRVAHGPATALLSLEVREVIQQ
jgi:hypothetical protein